MFDYATARMVAVECAKRAGELVVRELSNGSLTSESKPWTGDVVTSVDVASERYITSVLCHHFPSHTILGEEGCAIKKSSTFTWVIDPVDGTGKMLLGADYFGISIGLVENGMPVVGAIYFPKLGTLIETQRGVGTWINGKRIRFRELRPVAPFPLSALMFDFSCRKHNREVEAKRFLTRLPDPKNIPVYACTTYATLLLLRGEADAFVHAGAQACDFAAGILAVEESGGHYVFLEDPGSKKINPEVQFFPLIMSRDPALGKRLQEELLQQD